MPNALNRSSPLNNCNCLQWDFNTCWVYEKNMNAWLYVVLQYLNKKAVHLDFIGKLNLIQKPSPRGVLRKRCSENTQQIYRRTLVTKCDFNKVSKQPSKGVLRKKCSENMHQIYGRTPTYVEAWFQWICDFTSVVVFSSKCAECFQYTFSMKRRF